MPELNEFRLCITGIGCPQWPFSRKKLIFKMNLCLQMNELSDGRE
jgi:hypothetical protein